MKHHDACLILVKHLESIGYKCLPLRSKNSQGPDVTAINHFSSYRFEVKTLSRKGSGSWQAGKVEEARKYDDFVAVVHGKYLLIESMDNYLACCGPRGSRAFTSIVDLYDC